MGGNSVALFNFASANPSSGSLYLLYFRENLAKRFPKELIIKTVLDSNIELETGLAFILSNVFVLTYLDNYTNICLSDLKKPGYPKIKI